MTTCTSQLAIREPHTTSSPRSATPSAPSSTCVVAIDSSEQATHAAHVCGGGAATAAGAALGQQGRGSLALEAT